MKFDLKDFLVLDAIQQHGTFAKAALHLNRTPSAITQSIQKLEALLGLTLFDRSNYRLRITEEGQFFMERGRQILKQMDRLENDMHFIQKGWGSEFSIAIDDLLYTEGIFSLIKEFQKIAPNVSIKLYREVLNGCWDALLQERATLAIGASNEPPIGLPCAQKALGVTHFVFAIAPHHPLATLPDPLSDLEISAHYSIVISDTSQSLPVRTSGILPTQPKLIVPNLEAKIQAHIQGLGVGYLPRHRITHWLETGELIERSVSPLKSKAMLKTAWRTDNDNQILTWFLEQLDKPEVQKRFF